MPRVPLALLLMLIGTGHAGAFRVIDRWESTANGTAGARGDNVGLTWSIVPDGTPTSEGKPSSFIRLMDDAFAVTDRDSPLATRRWLPLINSVFERWSGLGGVRFEHEAHDDGTPLGAAGESGLRGDVRLAATEIDGLSRTLAIGQLPDTGDVLFDAADGPLLRDQRLDFLTLRNVLAHEVGHVLGLGHVSSMGSVMLMEPELSLATDGPGLDDIRGLHRLYGDRLELLGNDSLEVATALGPLDPGAAVAIGDGAATLFTRGGGPRSIDGLTDRDFYSFEVTQPGRLTVELEPLGGMFFQAFEPGSPERFVDANASNNLNLALWGGETAGRLLVEEGRPRGSVERIDGFLVEPGSFALEVFGVNDAVQLYELRLSFTATPVPEPSDLALALPFALAATRSGRSRPARR